MPKVVIAAGETEGTGWLFPEQDKAVDGEEYFELVLSKAEGATIADGIGVMTIIGDD